MRNNQPFLNTEMPLLLIDFTVYTLEYGVSKIPRQVYTSSSEFVYLFVLIKCRTMSAQCIRMLVRHNRRTFHHLHFLRVMLPIQFWLLNET